MSYKFDPENPFREEQPRVKTTLQTGTSKGLTVDAIEVDEGAWLIRKGKKND